MTYLVPIVIIFVMAFLLIAPLALTRARGVQAPVRPQGGPVGEEEEINGHQVVRIAREDADDMGHPIEKTLGYKCVECYKQETRKRAFVTGESCEENDG